MPSASAHPSSHRSLSGYPSSYGDAYGDAYRPSARRLVSTCLTIARGCKHVMLLPPACAHPADPQRVGAAFEEDLAGGAA